jgi:2-amino-4-hydroxy-6-hydroxymethyldihydropteridine diphosphokinase
MTGASSHTAYIGLGSNLDDPRFQVERALQALARLPQSSLLRRSHLYASAPWGVTSQPDFVNAAAALATQLPAQALMRALLDVERGFGRERGSDRWGPRVLDLDLLLYDDCRIDAPGLRLPHPHLHERAFVLLPLSEIAPALDVPGHGPVSELLARIDASGCRRLDRDGR